MFLSIPTVIAKLPKISLLIINGGLFCNQLEEILFAGISLCLYVQTGQTFRLFSDTTYCCFLVPFFYFHEIHFDHATNV